MPDWVNEDVEKRLIEVVNKFQKQEKKRKEKTPFFVENARSSATTRKT